MPDPAIRQAAAARPAGHIASAVVRARPEHVQAVAAAIAEHPGCEIHAVAGSRIVVVMEGADAAALADRLNAIAAMKQVLAACMVFEQALDPEPMNTA